MKNILILSSLALLSGGAFAQQVEMWSDVPVIVDAYGHKITPDGSFSTGEAVNTQSAWGRNNATGEIYYFDAASCGDGNSTSKYHVTVGTDKVFMKAAFLMPVKDQDPVLISTLEKYKESFAHGITWDGTRIVGIVSNRDTSTDDYHPDRQKMAYAPFYCDVDPQTNTASEAVLLPTPERDFFGLVPQYCTAQWISDDGKVILGQVIDNAGYFIYPIVYQQDSNGDWNYMLPSEPLFKETGLEIPKYPVPLMTKPQAVDYIQDPEIKALYQDLLNQYNEGLSDVNPNEMLNPATSSDPLMNQAEYNEYQSALSEYNNYIIFIYDPELTEYYDAYSRFIAKADNFLQSSMAMNRAGTLIGQTKMTSRFSGANPVSYYNPMIFNLSDGTYKIYGGDLEELEINQILPDGTLVAASPQPGPTSPDMTPQHSYICAPGSEEFVNIVDYIKNSNPDYYNWYQEYLYHAVPIGYDSNGAIAYKDMYVTGLVAVSDDFSTLSGGLDAWSWNYMDGNDYSYIFTNVKSPNAGVERISLETEDGTFIVFNLQGLKIMETKDKENLNSLPSGIYIINGKKIMIN